jgi:hypothetical protein
VFNTRAFADASISSDQHARLNDGFQFNVAKLRLQAVSRPSIDRSSIHPRDYGPAGVMGRANFENLSRFGIFWFRSP